MPIFATVVQLDAWLGPRTPLDPVPLLERASRAVVSLVRRPVAVDGAGLPTDAGQKQALADATCAIVEHWIGPEAAGQPAEQTLDGIIVSGGAPASGAVPAELDDIPPVARTILRDAGLIPAAVATA